MTSLSSALSAATTVRGSSDGLAEKEMEAAVPLPVHSTKYSMGTSRLDSEPMYPTICECEQRHENEYEQQPFRVSTVGLAF